MLIATVTDPQTMQNFWNALIPLMIAAGVALQQWNAAQGKKRGEETKQASADAASAAQAAATMASSAAIQVANHNTVSMEKLNTIVDQTNGINAALTAQVADQKKQIADLTNKPV